MSSPNRVVFTALIAIVSALKGPFVLGAASNPYTGTFNEDVAAAVRAQSRAKTASEWLASGYSPESVFGYARDLGNRLAWDALCEALTLLHDPELAYFEPEIRAGGAHSTLPCGTALEDRLARYWAATVHEAPVASAALPVREQRILRGHGFVSYDGGLRNGEVALVFEASPDPARTARVLEILQRFGAKALFLEQERGSENTRKTIELLLKSGQSLGARGDSTLSPASEVPDKAWKRLREGRMELRALSGLPVRLVRFPFGCMSSNLERRATQAGLGVLHASVEARDWQITDPSALALSVGKELERRRGGLLVLDLDLEQSLLALPSILAEIARLRLTLIQLAD